MSSKPRVPKYPATHSGVRDDRVLITKSLTTRTNPTANTGAFESGTHGSYRWRAIEESITRDTRILGNLRKFYRFCFLLLHRTKNFNERQPVMNAQGSIGEPEEDRTDDKRQKRSSEKCFAIYSVTTSCLDVKLPNRTYQTRARHKRLFCYLTEGRGRGKYVRDKSSEPRADRNVSDRSRHVTTGNILSWRAGELVWIISTIAIPTADLGGSS